MATTLTLFILGFVLLLKGADILTDAASALAKKLGVADFIIGVVIVGIGTSIPELMVGVFGNLKGFEKISLGTVIGSNTFNILVILGIAALISPLRLTKIQTWKHLPINILAVAVAGILVILSGSFFGLTRVAGFLLVTIFVAWLWYLYKMNGTMSTEDGDLTVPVTKPGFVSLAFAIAGLVGIVVGGEWVTESTVQIASYFGIKESIIGLTIVGIGTSLPELFASAVAAYKKEYSIAVGNVVGSNIFDFLMILGLSAAMRPMVFTPALFMDLIFTVSVAVLLLVSILIGKKYVLERWEGVVFVLLYLGYLAYLISFHP